MARSCFQCDIMYVACPVLPCVQAPGGFVAATERPFLVVQALHFSRPAKGFHPLDPQPVRRAAEVSQLPRWAALVDIKHPLSAVALREGGCTRREPIFLSAHSCGYVARQCLTANSTSQARLKPAREKSAGETNHSNSRTLQPPKNLISLIGLISLILPSSQ